MGCRLHWAETYRVEWTGGWFNWNAEVFRKILDHLGIQVWEVNEDSGDYGDFEMPVEEWKTLLTILKESRGLDSYSDPIMTTKELIAEGLSEREAECPLTYKDLDDWSQAVEKSYDKSNDCIRFSWF